MELKPMGMPDSAPLELEKASVTWQNLVVTAPQKGKVSKVLLDNCIGYVDPFHMVALMGPSGSGKTTLLDVLAGRKPSNLVATGEVLINGHATKLSYGTVSYVPQSDLLTGTLTVHETLTFTAALRLKQTGQERRDAVESVMQKLGLTTAANTPVGTTFIKGLSGGQKRRLSIGCELIVGPSVIFLDEPTSGLDSASAFYCMKALRTIVMEGRTVFMSIHQPSSEVYDLFDQLLLLSKGRMVYFGPASGALQYYSDCGLACPEHRAPADHFIFCLNTDFKTQAADFFGSSTASQVARAMESGSNNRDGVESVDHDSALQTLTAAFETQIRPDLDKRLESSKSSGKVYAGFQNQVSGISQFVTLTHRMLLNSQRDVGVFWLRLGMYLGLCVCLGTVYYQMGSNWKIVTARGGLLFFTVSFLTFMSVSGFPSFVDDMKIFVRERLNGYYGADAYTAASAVSAAPFLAVMSIMCSLVVYFLSGLNTSADRFFYFVLNLFSALMVVEALMMAIAAIVPHYLLGLAAGAGMLGMFMPVAGYIIPTTQIPNVVWRYPVHYLAYHNYALNGLMLNEFEGTSGWACPCSVLEGGCADSDCTITGEEVLKALDYGGNESKWVDIIILAGMFVGYRLLFFMTLKIREANSK